MPNAARRIAYGGEPPSPRAVSAITSNAVTSRCSGATPANAPRTSGKRSTAGMCRSFSAVSPSPAVDQRNSATASARRSPVGGGNLPSIPFPARSADFLIYTTE